MTWRKLLEIGKYLNSTNKPISEETRKGALQITLARCILSVEFETRRCSPNEPLLVKMKLEWEILLLMTDIQRKGSSTLRNDPFLVKPAPRVNILVFGSANLPIPNVKGNGDSEMLHVPL